MQTELTGAAAVVRECPAPAIVGLGYCPFLSHWDGSDYTGWSEPGSGSVSPKPLPDGGRVGMNVGDTHLIMATTCACKTEDSQMAADP